MPTDTPQARRALIEVSGDLADRLRDPRLVLAGVAGVAGAVALFVGWLGISDTLDPGRQLPYLISGGVGGLFLLGVAAALLFSADGAATRRDLRATRAELAALAERVEDLHDRLDGLGHDGDGGLGRDEPRSRSGAGTRRRRPVRAS